MYVAGDISKYSVCRRLLRTKYESDGDRRRKFTHAPPCCLAAATLEKISSHRFSRHFFRNNARKRRSTIPREWRDRERKQRTVQAPCNPSGRKIGAPQASVSRHCLYRKPRATLATPSREHSLPTPCARSAQKTMCARTLALFRLIHSFHDEHNTAIHPFFQTSKRPCAVAACSRRRAGAERLRFSSRKIRNAVTAYGRERCPHSIHTM